MKKVERLKIFKKIIQNDFSLIFPLMNGESTFNKLQYFLRGLIQLIAGIGRLGFLSMVLTDTVVSSFTVGASFHVITSQIKHVLGIR